MDMYKLYREQNAWQELHVEGNKLLNAQGDEIRLIGVNTARLEWMSYPVTLMKDVAYACDVWKANTIRLPLSQDRWFGFAKDQKSIDESGRRYRQLVDDIIGAVASRNKYIILDLHRSNLNKWGEFVTGNLTDMNSLVFWKDVAMRYGNHPNVIFDPHNEPYQVSWDTWLNGGEVTVLFQKTDIGQQIMFDKTGRSDLIEHKYQAPGMQEMIRVIRAVGAKNVLTVGGLDWSYELDGIVNGFAPDDCGGNGYMLDSHVYPVKPLDKWDDFVTVAKDKYPIIIGECGHYGEAPVKHEWPQLETSDKWVPRLLNWIDEHGYHLTAWDFHHTAGPQLVENLDDYTPTSFWGVYVKEFLLKHNGEK